MWDHFDLPCRFSLGLSRQPCAGSSSSLSHFTLDFLHSTLLSLVFHARPLPPYNGPSAADAPENIPQAEGLAVDDGRYSSFFLQPTDPAHRRYEVLRAIFVEHQPMADVAQRLGYRYDTVRTLVSDFRHQLDGGQVPPFSPPRAGADPEAILPPRSPYPRSR